MNECVYVIYWFFFFQAEDGIRDLVRSRGLGDVYKRQGLPPVKDQPSVTWKTRRALRKAMELDLLIGSFYPVSYTHLTLPTSDLV